MQRITEETKTKLTHFAICILIDEYHFSDIAARKLVEKSSFNKLFTVDPEYDCHTDVRDWVILMMKEEIAAEC